MKRCSKCGETNLAAFAKNRCRPDGLQYWCRACISAAAKSWRERNGERAVAKNRQWVRANRERSNEYHRRWTGAHRSADAMTDLYVRHALREGGATVITPELVELKRAQLLVHRGVRALNTAIREVNDGDNVRGTAGNAD